MPEEDKEVIEIEKNVKEKKVRWIVGVLVAVALIILIVYKTQNPEFPFLTLILISGGILIVGGLIFFGAELYRKFKSLGEKEDEIEGIPKAATTEQIENALREFVLKRRNHIKEIMEIHPFNVGKNSIYAYKILMLYKEIGLGGREAFIILNANYLKEKPFSIVPGDSKFNLIKRLCNGISSSPEEDPDVEVTEEKSPLTGVERKTTKKTHKEKKPKKKEDGEEIS